MDAAAASGQPRAQDAATHSNSSSSPSRPRWRRQVRREKRGDYAERCTGLAWALSFVSRRSLLFHHAVTFIFQVAAVCMVGLLGDAEGKAARLVSTEGRDEVWRHAAGGAAPAWLPASAKPSILSWVWQRR